MTHRPPAPDHTLVAHNSSAIVAPGSVHPALIGTSALPPASATLSVRPGPTNTAADGSNLGAKPHVS